MNLCKIVALAPLKKKQKTSEFEPDVGSLRTLSDYAFFEFYQNAVDKDNGAEAQYNLGLKIS